MALSSPPELVVHMKKPPEEKVGYCDSCWACILNDYIEKDEWFDDFTFMTGMSGASTIPRPLAENEIREVQHLEIIMENRHDDGDINDDDENRHGKKKKKKKDRSKKKKTKKKKQRQVESPIPSLSGALDDPVPEHIEMHEENLHQNKSLLDGQVEDVNETVNPIGINISVSEERDALELIRLGDEKILEQLPFRAPQRVISSGPEISSNRDVKRFDRQEDESRYGNMMNQIPSSVSQGQLSNHDRAQIELALAKSRSKSRSRRLKRQADLQLALERSLSKQKEKERDPPEVSKSEEPETHAPRGKTLSRPKSGTKSTGKSVLDPVPPESDSMPAEQYQKVDAYHYAPQAIQDAVVPPHSYDAMEQKPPLEVLPDPHFQEEAAPRLSIPLEVKVKKKPKLKPLKDAEKKKKADPEEERLDRSGHSRTSHRSSKSTRSSRTRSSSRSRSRGRPRPEDLYVEDLSPYAPGDGSIYHPIEISSSRRNGSMHISTSPRHRDRKQDVDPVGPVQRIKNRDPGRRERAGPLHTNYEDDRNLLSIRDGKKVKKEGSRRRKVDRQEALERIRAIKARLASVDP